MDKAKAAISDFMSRSGQHDTTVHESVAPAVQHETVKPHQHENITTAVDKEVHQDHYHRTVQPVHDREVLPETHTHNLGDVKHVEHDHRDHDHTKRHLERDQAQFRDQTTTENTTSSRSVAPVVGGEHVHHHIHETIQPVVHKETIQPNVVHTTVPIHEVHHNKATHHDTTALPAMTMDQFKNKGGVLSGREERYDEFQGVPKNLGSGTAGGFGAVRGLEHKTEPHSKERASHGDYHDTAHHEMSADMQKGGLTHNSTTAGAQGLTGSSTTGGMTGHHHEGHHHEGRNLAAGAAAGAAAGTAAHHHHEGHQHGTTAGGLTGSSTGTGMTGSSTGTGMMGSSTGTGMTGHHHEGHHHTGQGLTGSNTSGGLTGTDQTRAADRGTLGQGQQPGF